jgi:hypothetical protein
MQNLLPTRKAVFVMDDDACVLKATGRLLRQHGFETALFSSAEAFQVHGKFDTACCTQDHGLAIEDEGLRPELAGGFDDQRIAAGPVIAAPRKQPHTDDAPAVFSGSSMQVIQ